MAFISISFHGTLSHQGTAKKARPVKVGSQASGTQLLNLYSMSFSHIVSLMCMKLIQPFLILQASSLIKSIANTGVMHNILCQSHPLVTSESKGLKF